MVTRPVAESSTSSHHPSPVDVLILGAGWTSTFLIPLLKKEKVSHTATSTTGHDDTIPFRFDPESSSLDQYNPLPDARTVLITFPLKGPGQSKLLVSNYERSRSSSSSTTPAETTQGEHIKDQRLYIQLGSTGIFTAPHWNDCNAPHDAANPRAIAEDELLSLSSAPHQMTTASGKPITTTVLNLAGLWGGERQPRNWLSRVIKSRADVEGRKALHLVHGEDVSGGILGAHLHREKVVGRRWILTDLHVYDWWDLIVQWATEETDARRKLEPEGPSEGMQVLGPWVETKGRLRTFEVGEGEKKETLDLQEVVFEALEENGVRALPRGPEQLGRVLDSRDFWKAVGRHPVVGRVL